MYHSCRVAGKNYLPATRNYTIERGEEMKKYFVGLLVIVILLTGCSNSKPSIDADSVRVKNESDTETVELTYPDFTEHYEHEDGNVKFNCNIKISTDLNTKKLYTATANQCEINVEHAFQELYSQIADYETYEYEEKNEYGNTVKTATYVDKNETSFSYGPMSSKLSFMKMDKMPYILAAFRLDESDDDYNADLYSTENQLAFASREETYTNLMTLFQKIDAPTEYKYKAYALDHDTLKSQEKHEDINGNSDDSSYKTNWSSADDCYYFVMRQYFEEIPVYHVYADIFSMESDMNTPVQAVVSSEGIESLDIEKIFSFSDKKVVTNIMPFDKVAASVTDKYNQILGAGTYEITSAELYYYVDLSSGIGTYDVYPCWILKGNELQNNDRNKIQIIMNAQTGEEIIP